MYKTPTNLYQAQVQISLDNVVKGTPKKTPCHPTEVYKVLSEAKGHISEI